MTRNEFLEISEMWELIDFCNGAGCDDLSGVLSEDDYNSWVEDEIKERLRREYWWDIRDWLHDLPSSSETEYYDVGGDYPTEIDDDDFENYKDDILNWADSYYTFDEEEDAEEEEDEPVQEPEDPGFETEDFSMQEMFESAQNFVEELSDSRRRQEKEYEEFLSCYEAAC